jgi:hypothetical protein
VLHAHGIGLRVIAKTIGCDVNTLRKYFREELRDARLHVEAAMGAAIIAAANRGAWGAAKYWLTCFGGPQWRVPERHVLSGDPDTPPVRVQLDIEHMTEQEIQAELAELRRRRAAADAARAMADGLPGRMN